MASSRGIYTDGVVKNDYYFDDHDEVMTVKQTQPNEKLILDRNAELRRNKGALKKLTTREGKTWGQQQASIPFIMYNKVCKEGKYDLQDNEDLQRWLTETHEGRTCLV